MVMDAWVLLVPDVGSPLGKSRDRVLDLLLTTSRPLDVQDVARQVGLHPNTARFHLDALVGCGLAMRGSRRRDTPGRPRLTYWAAPGSTPAGRRRYRLLAEMLTGMVAEMVSEPGEAAAAAGREWGRCLTAQPPSFRRLGPRKAVEKLTAALTNIGFGAETVEAVASGGGYRLRLYQCPFREVAERHREVVCALHLGLVQGVLRQLRAPITADRLLPFAEPGVCLTELGAGQAQDDTRPVRRLLGQAISGLLCAGDHLFTTDQEHRYAHLLDPENRLPGRVHDRQQPARHGLACRGRCDRAAWAGLGRRVSRLV